MRLRDVLKVVRERWLLVVASILAALAAAELLNLATTPLYESSIRFFVSAADVTAPSDAAAAYQGDLLSQQRAASYAQLLTDPSLAARVVAEMGLPMTPTELAHEVTARPVAGTVLLDATVTDTSAERARDIADVLGRQFAAQVAELETPDGASRPTVEVSVVHPPGLNPDAVRPVVPRNLAIGLVLGVIIGVCVALLRHRLDNSVRTSENVRDTTGLEPIGTIPEDTQLGDQPVAESQGRQSATAEAFRAIRTRLELLDEDHPPRVVVITSAVPGEGKTTLAVNLAAALGQAGHRVMLIEADLWHPGLAAYLRLSGRPGLIDVLARTAELGAVTQRWEAGKITVLPAGVTSADSDEVMSAAQMRKLLHSVGEVHDFVIVDSPALSTSSDAAGLSAIADGCLLMARVGVSRRDQLSEAVAMLARMDVNLLGVVLNQVPRPTAAGGSHRRDRVASDREAPADSSAPESAAGSTRSGTGQRSDGGLVPAVRSQDKGSAV